MLGIKISLKRTEANDLHDPTRVLPSPSYQRYIERAAGCELLTSPDVSQVVRTTRGVPSPPPKGSVGRRSARGANAGECRGISASTSSRHWCGGICGLLFRFRVFSICVPPVLCLSDVSLRLCDSMLPHIIHVVYCCCCPMGTRLCIRWRVHMYR